MLRLQSPLKDYLTVMESTTQKVANRFIHAYHRNGNVGPIVGCFVRGVTSAAAPPSLLIEAIVCSCTQFNREVSWRSVVLTAESRYCQTIRFSFSGLVSHGRQGVTKLFVVVRPDCSTDCSLLSNVSGRPERVALP